VAFTSVLYVSILCVSVLGMAIRYGSELCMAVVRHGSRQSQAGRSGILRVRWDKPFDGMSCSMGRAIR
jgi:hypothetical protein